MKIILAIAVTSLFISTHARADGTFFSCIGLCSDCPSDSGAEAISCSQVPMQSVGKTQDSAFQRLQAQCTVSPFRLGRMLGYVVNGQQDPALPPVDPNAPLDPAQFCQLEDPNT